MHEKMSPKTCVLDSIPTSLLFECSNQVVLLLTTIVNQSLATGIFPSCMKSAVVKPLLKKTSLHQNVLKHFRPISNLPFVSKLIEKLVLDQHFRHLNNNNLWHTFQSAYRAKHGTKTALLRVLNDLLTASDSGSVSILTLQDLSAAFDTIDYSILLTRLDSTFGIRDLALSFFRSYLRDRTQIVTVNGIKSSPSLLTCGVPLGSVLGPILFILYTQPLSDVISHHSVSHHMFGDDSELYKSDSSFEAFSLTEH